MYSTDEDSARSRLSTALFALCLVTTSLLPIAAIVQPPAARAQASVACGDASVTRTASNAGAQAMAVSNS